MKRPILVLLIADHHIMRLTTRVAHYIDWRWHRNHFDVAGYWLKAGVAGYVAGIVGNLVLSHTITTAISMGLGLLTLYWTYGWMRQLERASRAFERDITRIPSDAIGFVIFPPPLRAMMAGMSMALMLAILPLALYTNHIGVVLSAVYPVGLSGMFYFAGSFPSGKPRREKQERAAMLPALPLPA